MPISFGSNDSSGASNYIRANLPLHLCCNFCLSSLEVHCEFPIPILWLFCLAMKIKKGKKSLKNRRYKYMWKESVGLSSQKTKPKPQF